MEPNDITVLQNFINLTSLSLRYSRISSIDSLQKLKKLTSLTLRCTKNINVVDISAIGNLVNLKILDLTYINVFSIDDFDKLINLEELTIMNFTHINTKKRNIIIPKLKKCRLDLTKYIAHYINMFTVEDFAIYINNDIDSGDQLNEYLQSIVNPNICKIFYMGDMREINTHFDPMDNYLINNFLSTMINIEDFSLCMMNSFIFCHDILQHFKQLRVLYISIGDMGLCTERIQLAPINNKTLEHISSFDLKFLKKFIIGTYTSVTNIGIGFLSKIKSISEIFMCKSEITSLIPFLDFPNLEILTLNKKNILSNDEQILMNTMPKLKKINLF